MARHHTRAVRDENGQQNGQENIPFSEEEEAAQDVREAAVATKRADYIANHKYKDDRREAYGDIGDQLDMLYWDQCNDTTTFKDHIAAVKAAHPKP